MSIEKVAKNLKAFKEAIDEHDLKCKFAAYGIGMAHFDMERLGFEEGENLWGNICMYSDAGQSGRFRVLCGGEHDDALDSMEEEVLAYGKPAIIFVSVGDEQ